VVGCLEKKKEATSQEEVAFFSFFLEKNFFVLSFLCAFLFI